MKKILIVMLTLILAVSLIACTDKKEKEGSGESINVDEGLLFVDVTIPAAFFEDMTEAEIKEEAKEEGYKNCVINEDGSVTYTMTKLQHKEALREYKEEIDENIDDMLNGEDQASSFVSIDYNDTMTKFDIYVDSSLYSDWDSLYALTFYFSGMLYQAIDGVAEEDIDVEVSFIDNETKEVLDSGSYKEFMSDADDLEGLE
ncbi:MAG: hypothetical protein IJP16_07085 [Clostridia bacterium]|nr:hypothetical protein [Clostridia bacterium]